ncbi:hypothetical protein BDR22DRAFT_619672 [Usnea florida]
MYTVRKVALVALVVTTSTLSSPVSGALLPPPVECVDGQPVGVNLPITTLPNPFTVQVISKGDDPSSLPLVLGEPLGFQETPEGDLPSFRIRMGAVSKNPGISFTLSDGQVNFNESLLLTTVASRIQNTLDLGIAPGFPYGLNIAAQYVCRSDNTPVLVLMNPATTNRFGTTLGGAFFITSPTSEILPDDTVELTGFESRSNINLSVIGGVDELL